MQQTNNQKMSMQHFKLMSPFFFPLQRPVHTSGKRLEGGEGKGGRREGSNARKKNIWVG